ncbi:DegT/DnrJ/EryC1/StrS family aminotransferase [Micromonospora chersina]|uniref:DegT/DnrJ/EryC1/StrS aminotransferase family protein n=1 Tax=Micromonospora chersina TaxID=47854 RepID=UPI0034091F4B
MTSVRTAPLALFGGTPVHDRNWPVWPQGSAATLRNLQEAATSGRWAISGTYQGAPCFEQRFARAFADYHGVSYAVPTTNGSSALTIAMEALGVGPGSEVIVPGLTWVACASAAAALGAVPILVDVDPGTLSISAAAAEAAITPQTRAILVVHAYCSAADIDAFVALSERTGIPIIEDCSQAHGAEWNGRKVGTFGTIGAFSLQQTKVLTCGEGGITITDSPELYDHLQQFRANGRRFTAKPVVGEMDLEEAGTVEGHNYCMSEFHAAVALAQLEDFDKQQAHRLANAARLDVELARIPGVSPLVLPANLTKRTVYDYVIRLNPDVLGPFSVSRVVSALAAELNCFVETLDAPLNANPLYVPLKSPRLPDSDEVRQLFHPGRFELPEATAAFHSCVALLHHSLLGTDDDMTAIVTAVDKVVANIDHLRPEQ